MEKPPAPPAREHVLSDIEVQLFWQATPKLSAPFDSFARILLLTGQRRSEVAGMAWAELDRASATWTIPKARAKNKAANIVPLSAPVMAELDALAVKVWGGNWPDGKRIWPIDGLVLTTTGKTPISGLSKAKAKLDTEMVKLAGQRPVEPWRFHDIRRTVATSMQRLGVRLEVTEAALHHLSGSRAGIVGVYQRHDWKDEKRAALEAWAARVEAIVAGLC
jgi:integrase